LFPGPKLLNQIAVSFVYDEIYRPNLSEIGIFLFSTLITLRIEVLFKKFNHWIIQKTLKQFTGIDSSSYRLKKLGLKKTFFKRVSKGLTKLAQKSKHDDVSQCFNFLILILKAENEHKCSSSATVTDEMFLARNISKS
jgi:hypothetical protein